MDLIVIQKPLDERLEYISDWIECDFKRVRLNSYSDLILQVNLEFCHDIDTKILDTLKIPARTPSGMWRSAVSDVMFPYVRIRIINQTAKKNETLCVILSGLSPLKKEIHSVKSESSPRISGKKPEDSPSSLSLDDDSKPKHRLFFGKKRPLSQSKQAPPVSILDQRLPPYIPQDCILIGGKMGKSTILAKGNPGEILRMGISGPEWHLVYPPVQLSEESKKQLNWVDQ